MILTPRVFCDGNIVWVKVMLEPQNEPCGPQNGPVMAHNGNALYCRCSFVSIDAHLLIQLSSHAYHLTLSCSSQMNTHSNSQVVHVPHHISIPCLCFTLSTAFCLSACINAIVQRMLLCHYHGRSYYRGPRLFLSRSWVHPSKKLLVRVILVIFGHFASSDFKVWLRWWLLIPIQRDWAYVQVIMQCMHHQSCKRTFQLPSCHGIVSHLHHPLFVSSW